MAYDERLAERIRQVFGERRDITERKMFGGLAFLLKGRMCCGIVGSDLMVRVTDDEFEAVMRGPDVRPMDFTGKPVRGFVYVAPRGVRTATALRTWLSPWGTGRAGEGGGIQARATEKFRFIRSFSASCPESPGEATIVVGRPRLSTTS
jgi:hypothetical protein